MAKKLKVARIVTIPGAFVHIKRQLSFLKTSGVELTLISSKGDYQETLGSEVGAKQVSLEIPRGINLFSDLKALIQLYLHFRENSYDIVHSSTPKAGLLVAWAAFLAGVPKRFHTFTGQRWATLKGFKRFLLRLFDRQILALNTKCYADSPSQVEFLNQEGIGKGRLSCLGSGSFGGIDFERFDRKKFASQKQIVSKELGLSLESLLYIFVGRITKDKGVEELLCAFEKLSGEFNVELLLLGTFEPELDPISKEAEQLIKKNPRIHFLGFKKNPEYYMAAADLFILPSYREGFGTVIIEAAGLGVPSIGTKIPGLVDAIVDGETGVLIEKENTLELTEALRRLSRDRDELKRLGEQAFLRAEREFSFERISKLQLEEYLSSESF